MYVRELTVSNFRRFKEETFVFPEDVTVLVGDNGTGKSALLDALAVAAGSVLLELRSDASRSIASADVRLERFVHGDVVTAEAQVPCVISADGEFDGARFRWQRALNRIGGRTDRGGAAELRQESKRLREEVVAGHPRDLPLVAFYSTARLWLHKRDRPQKAGRWSSPASRLDGYVDALESASSQKLFLAWMRARVAGSLQLRRPPSDLEAVRNALVAALPEDWNAIDYDLTSDELIAVRVDNGHIADRLPFQLLSDGQRTMLALVADLAYRCAVLNPHLEAQAAASTRGIVMIDEIDLHLHPRWQRRVLDDLRAAFPSLQFVTTTHSPFVVQTRGPGQLIDLSRPEAHVPGGPPNSPEQADFRVYGIEDIAQEAMRVDNAQWSRARREMWSVAARFYELLAKSRPEDKVELDRLRKKLDQLTARFSDNPAYHALLESERMASGIDDDHG